MRVSDGESAQPLLSIASIRMNLVRKLDSILEKRLLRRMMTSFKFRFFAVSILTAFLSISAYSQVIYNSIPSTLPGNIASAGYEATGTSEFGDRVQFSNGTSRTLVGVTQTMSIWRCEHGTWFGHNCVTTP